MYMRCHVRYKYNMNRGDIVYLWEYLKHGDMDHQMWLYEAIEAWSQELERPSVK